MAIIRIKPFGLNAALLQHKHIGCANTDRCGCDDAHTHRPGRSP